MEERRTGGLGLDVQWFLTDRLMLEVPGQCKFKVYADGDSVLAVREWLSGTISSPWRRCGLTVLACGTNMLVFW